MSLGLDDIASGNEREDLRISVLHALNILDTPAEAGFDDIVRLVAEACDTPVALVSFVDVDRQWFKAKIGFNGCETPLDQSVCAHVVREKTLIVIPDLREDPRTKANTLVTADPHIRFYAGAPLITPGGEVLGSLCVIDDKPRAAGLTERQANTLVALARQVMIQLELRQALQQNAVQTKLLEAAQRDILAERTSERDRLWRISQDILISLDTSGMFVSVSPVVTEILGWTPEEMIGRNVVEFVIPDDVSLTNSALKHAAKNILPTTENRYRHKDGGFRWMSWLAAPEGDLIFATGRHITAEKEAAERLAASDAALRQAQKMEAVGQLTGGLAHDFNNLLTGIMGNLELLQSRVAKGQFDSVDRFVNAAQGAGRRAAALTQRLLAFSRRQTLDPKPTDVNRLITGMEDLLRRTVGQMVQIEVVGAAGLWTALIDPSQMENALLNLCINARDAMPDGGKLTIETANKWLDERTGHERDLPPGQYLSICVTDTGTGMTPETIERVFEPFFTTKPTGQGTGLGLSMIYGFARQSGGQVRIYSELGSGTTMCIYLPRHLGDAENDVVIERSSPEGNSGGETVLVVDDEPTIRHLIDEVLDDLGYTVIGAADGVAGLKVLQSGARVELLITDVGLPNGMNGRQVADAARSLRPDLKILFITGYAENAAFNNGHLEPGMALLTKPFSMEDLTQKVRTMLDRP